MNITLRRFDFGETYTIGELCIDDVFECYTLEDVVRPDGEKVYGKTAIPEGTYDVVVTMSQRFKRLLPLLLKVPQFEGVRIHPGNRPEDTEGCILVGRKKGSGEIYESRAAFSSLLDKISEACKTDKVRITISNG